MTPKLMSRLLVASAAMALALLVVLLSDGELVRTSSADASSADASTSPRSPDDDPITLFADAVHSRGIEAANFVELGETAAGSRYWTIEGNDQVCVLGTLPSGVGGSSCVASSVWKQEGLGLVLTEGSALVVEGLVTTEADLKAEGVFLHPSIDAIAHLIPGDATIADGFVYMTVPLDESARLDALAAIAKGARQ